MPSKHWKRKLRISVGGTTMNLDDLQTEFQVRCASSQQPDQAYIRIINLSDKTSNSIFEQGLSVNIYAGYHEGPYGEIFSGTVNEMRRGKMNGTDKYHDILAITGDKAYKYAEVSKSLEKGATYKDIIMAAVQAMQKMGVEIGHIDDFSSVKLNKGVTLNWMARDILREAAETVNGVWTVFNNKLQFIKVDGSAPGSYTINGDSGMIGMPEQTLTGINVRILINPNIRIDQKVHIDSKSIQQAMRRTTSYTDLPLKDIMPGINVDGDYKVIRIDHDGSLLGTEWYTTLTCVAEGKEGIKGSQNRTITPPRGITETETGGQGGGGGGGSS